MLITISRDLSLSDQKGRHEDKSQSDRCAARHAVPAERRRTDDSGIGGGAVFVLTHAAIKSAVEQSGVRGAVREEILRLRFRIQEATAVQLRYRQTMDRQ